MNRAVTYLAVYKPKPGKDAEVMALVRRHVPALRKEGLLIEIASWKSEDSARAAHANPRVMEIWGAFAACCDFQQLKNLAEAQQEFAHFERLEGVVS